MLGAVAPADQQGLDSRPQDASLDPQQPQISQQTRTACKVSTLSCPDAELEAALLLTAEQAQEYGLVERVL